MNKLRWQTFLMFVVIVVIAGFQVYWLQDNYKREQEAIEVRTDALFHETVRQVQDSLLEQRWEDILSKDSTAGKVLKDKIFNRRVKAPLSTHPARILRQIGQSIPADSADMKNKSKGVFISIKNDEAEDSDIHLVLDSFQKKGINKAIITKARKKDQLPGSLQTETKSSNAKFLSVSETLSSDSNKKGFTETNTLIFDNEKGEQFKIRIDSLVTDSIPVTLLTAAFRNTLNQQNLDLPFTILRQKEEMAEDDVFIRRPLFGSIGGYKLQLGNTFSYLISQISLPILFSVFLVGLTVFAFVLLYRSLLKQQRLAQMKNELISNITHELKTPIATVGVAIEALKNFNAIQDPQRTKEYLDISQNELQRLGLLVDKVLKLSMFEKKEIELKHELFDLKDVVNEVVTSLRLQIEKINASVAVEIEGDTSLKADRLHLLSVVFNLLDNALKYSKDNPVIEVTLKEDTDNVIMRVKDNGIGIPSAYKEKIFEKFFRVPSGDTHDAKGHGLGLSYAAQVLRQHNGSIAVESQEGIGSTFTITIPKAQGKT